METIGRLNVAIGTLEAVVFAASAVTLPNSQPDETNTHHAYQASAEPRNEPDDNLLNSKQTLNPKP